MARAAQPHRGGEAEERGAPLDGDEVRIGRFVRDEDEARVGPVHVQAREGVEEDLLVAGPGRAGHQGGCAVAVAEERVVGANGSDLGHDAVEARVAGHADAAPGDAEGHEPRRVVLGNRPGGGEAGVPGAEERPGGPREAAAARRHRPRHHRHPGARGRGPRGELGPEVELGKGEDGRPERREERGDLAGEVPGEIVRDVHRQPTAE